ncbi:MAG: LPXTG cell wall anchor domain-containing protein [Andreesenia angusta]|nr:LPXTG cell wall anchor domain-containing protein [Andreesenia angusta]
MKKKLAIVSLAALMMLTSNYMDSESLADKEETQNAIEMKIDEFKQKTEINDIKDKSIKEYYFVPISFVDSSGNIIEDLKLGFGESLTKAGGEKENVALVVEYNDGKGKIAYIDINKGNINFNKITSTSDTTINFENANIPSFKAISLSDGKSEIDLSGEYAKDNASKTFSGNLKFDFSKKYTIKVKTPESINNDDNISVVAEKFYKVPVKLKKKDSDEDAKGSLAVLGEAIVVEKDGKSEIYIDTAPLETNDSLGFILSISAYEGDFTTNKSKAGIVQKIKYTITDSSDDSKKEVIKPKIFLINRNKTGETEIFIEIDADQDDLFDSQARLVLDYSNKKEDPNGKRPGSATPIEGGEKKKKPSKKPGGKKPGGDKPGDDKPGDKPGGKTPSGGTTPSGDQKLPQTGSPIDTITLISGGVLSILGGLYIYRKR